MMTVQYIMYTARAISSSLKAVLVLPVPETARKSTCPPALKRYEHAITISAGTDAVTSDGMSVYMRAMPSGKRQNIRIITPTIPYASFMMRLTRDITLSWRPSPMMLLTKVLHVEEND